MKRLVAWFSALLLLTACATAPKFDTAGVNTTLAPRAAAEHPDTAVGQRVLWGGVIVHGTNLESSSRLEVLGYPLGSDQRPDVDAAPIGRFLIEKPGYLELEDYSAGRLVTVSGELARVQPGRVGQAPYSFPVVQAARLHLWEQPRRAVEPQLHFGIGVIFSGH